MGSEALVPDEDLTPRDDEIVAEVRAVRERLAAAAGHDLDRLVEHLRTIEAEERARGRIVLTPPAERATEPGVAAGRPR
jgi:hypothetical protein